MSKDEVKSYYIAYLDDKLSCGTLSKGAYQLLKLSESSFNDYYALFESSQLYRERQIEIHKAWSRDKKITEILNGGTDGDNRG